MKVILPHQYRWLQITILGILLFNVIDGILTIIWILSGNAIETNPLLESLVNQHPLLFMITKLSLVVLGVILLWRLKHHPLAIISIFIVFLLYYYVLLIHLRAMNIELIESIIKKMGLT